jgi:hypothetical protein
VTRSIRFFCSFCKIYFYLLFLIMVFPCHLKNEGKVFFFSFIFYIKHTHTLSFYLSYTYTHTQISERTHPISLSHTRAYYARDQFKNVDIFIFVSFPSFRLKNFSFIFFIFSARLNFLFRIL